MRSAHRHSWPTIALHWASVLAVVVAAGAALAREVVEAEPARALLMQVHKQAGLFVLVALVLRIVARLALGFGDHAGRMHVALRWAARLAHMGLYGLLLALPVLGLLVCSASAMNVSFFGLFRLPQLIQDDPDVAANLADYHVWTAWGLLFMVVLHIAAALWHHLLRRDGVMAAMLPLVDAPDRRAAPKAAAPHDAGVSEYPPLRDAA